MCACVCECACACACVSVGIVAQALWSLRCPSSRLASLHILIGWCACRADSNSRLSPHPTAIEVHNKLITLAAAIHVAVVCGVGGYGEDPDRHSSSCNNSADAQSISRSASSGDACHMECKHGSAGLANTAYSSYGGARGATTYEVNWWLTPAETHLLRALGRSRIPRTLC